MISKQICEHALARALCSGGDFAELFAEDTSVGTIALQSGRIENALSGREHGAGIRIFKGTATVYAYTNDTSLPGLLALADQAAAALGSAGCDGSVALGETARVKRHPFLVLPHSVEMARKTAMLKQACAAASDYDSAVKQVNGTMLERRQNVLIANTEGLYTGDERCYVRMAVTAVASDGRENQTGSASPGAMRGYEFYDTLDLEALGRESAYTAVTMLRAPVCPAGVMPVIIDNGFGGVLFHEACGHSLEATSVAKGTSQFSGKLGQQIAAPIVSAVDDGTLVNQWGSANIDDEGMPTQRNLLIDKGVLVGYMIDRLGARRMNMARTGSGRRQNYTYAPTSRMTNTFICPGDSDEAEMIATMGDGLYAKKMGGGSVNPATGEFNFAVMEGYLVRDGKIAHPVRGASLIGKGDQVLMKIDRVGRQMTFGQGMCGSLSGSIPANVGQPMIRISSMTVGGR